jgi:hypothetical protein
LHEASGSLTWNHLTDTFKIVLPRNIYFLDESTKTKISWKNEPVYGTSDKVPLIMRGDKISIDLGYSYFKPTQEAEFDRTEIVNETVNRFNGYITKIRSDSPIEITCEDNMFALKQTVVENKTWNVDGKTYTLETMLKEMLFNSTYPGVSQFNIKTDNYKHSIQKFYTQGFTMAQVLDDLRKNYHLESFFVGNELRCGVIRYYPETRVTHAFDFMRNIASDDLEYQRADDMRIGIIAKSIEKVELVSTNSKGKLKTKHEQLTVTVGDKDGELRTLFFWGAGTMANLKTLAEAKLPFIKYEGFRGSFTTFGLPKVNHGDAVQLRDETYPEKNGTYLVKSVEPMSGVGNGLKQRISLDIRIDGLTTDQLTEFNKNGL